MNKGLILMLSFIKQQRWLLLGLVALTANQVYGHGMSEADKVKILDAGYWGYIQLGGTHMLTGYDHLLFLFGVIFFLTKFKDIVKFITAFTIGHSITLIFATIYTIQANYFLVDAVIALTVCYKGFDNLDGFKKYFKVEAPNLIGMVFAFGLIHGFGLSTRLQQLPLGDDGIVLRIISFNVGVELGQIIALSVMLLILSGWRKRESFKHFSNASNVSLILVGSLLFLMQMHGYQHTANPEEFALDTPPAQQVEKDNQTPTIKNAEEVEQSDWQDSITISIPAGKGKEYKFYVQKGESLKYSWKTKSGSLFYDFHGEPKGGAAGAFESFEKGTKNESSGSFTAPFEGSHGWYWGNKGTQTVEVTLKTKGSYKIIGIR